MGTKMISVETFTIGVQADNNYDLYREAFTIVLADINSPDTVCLYRKVLNNSVCNKEKCSREYVDSLFGAPKAHDTCLGNYTIFEKVTLDVEEYFLLKLSDDIYRAFSTKPIKTVRMNRFYFEKFNEMAYGWNYRRYFSMHLGAIAPRCTWSPYIPLL
jgi:hypothetical protein